MKIGFFTEGRFYGHVGVDNPNMRTDLAWIHALDAEHIYLYDFSESLKFDIGIVIVPKGRVDVPIDKLKKICSKVAIMQEGPNNYWTDYTMLDQIKYLELLHSADFLLCHNEIDISYYTGLTDKHVYVMPPVIIEENIQHIQRNSIKDKTRAHSIIGGNMCSWYNGMVSFIIAKNYSDKVFAPSMGRKVPGEERIQGLEHLPYLNWRNWMETLNQFAVGVHMMPTVAAGTFSLNCAYLGIPCIGNEDVDSQSKLHPDLSFNINDVHGAVEAIRNLRDDITTYNILADICRGNYYDLFHSTKFKELMTNVFEAELPS